jgi:acyl dehydratase
MSSILETCAPGTTVAEGTFGPFTRADLRRYADASGDLNPLHLDPEFARQAGFDDVIVHGMLGMALLGRLITQHFSTYPLLSFRARFRHIIRPGETFHCRARLRARDPNTAIVDLEGRNPTGTVLLEGTAELQSP